MLKIFKKKNKGFTLIELLVVIAVIGLLASIVLVSVGPARKKARDARRLSDVRQINLAMEMCYDDSGCAGAEQYPDSENYANDIDKIDEDGTPLYLDVPCDPLDTDCDTEKGDDDHEYVWINGTTQYYCVYVQLEAPSDTTWACASNKGVAQQESADTPTKDDCCGMDVDD